MFPKKTIFTILLLFLFSDLAHSGDAILPPRLWHAEVKNGDHSSKIFLLAATHIGLSSEFDSYFFNTVREKFNKSNVFHFEGAGGREDEPVPKCDENILTNEGKEILKNMRSVVANRFYEQKILLKLSGKLRDSRSDEALSNIARNYVDSLDEFDLIQFDKSIPSSRNNIEKDFSLEVFKSVVTTLLAANKNISVVDLDTKFGMRRAYCKASADRIFYLRDNISPVKVAPGNIEEYAESLNSDLINIVSTAGKLDLKKSKMVFFERSVICERNNEWLNEIKKINDGKIHFYAIGAIHFFDIDQHGVKCNGLLSLLKNNNINAEIVH